MMARWFRFDGVVMRQSVRPQQPQRFDGGFARDILPVAAFEKRRARCQRVTEVISPALSKMNQPPAIIITGQRRCAVRPRDPHQMIEHQLQTLLDHTGQLHVTQPCQRHQMRIKIRRVAVVRRRLLEINAVLAHLNGQLFKQHPITQVAPFTAALQFSQRRAEVKQAQRFAGQMSVRAEVMRQVSFNVNAVRNQKLHQSQHKVR